jgi:hypothetical protein
LDRAGKQECQHEWLRLLQSTGGRLLTRAKEDDWYYVVPERMAREIAAVKFPPCKARLLILKKRIQQQHGGIHVNRPVAPIVRERPNYNDTIETLDNEEESKYKEDDTVIANKTLSEDVDNKYGTVGYDGSEQKNDWKREIDKFDFQEYLVECASSVKVQLPLSKNSCVAANSGTLDSKPAYRSTPLQCLEADDFIDDCVTVTNDDREHIEEIIGYAIHQVSQVFEFPNFPLHVDESFFDAAERSLKDDILQQMMNLESNIDDGKSERSTKY